MGSFSVSASQIMSRAEELGVEAEGVELDGSTIVAIFEGIGRDDLAKVVQQLVSGDGDASMRIHSEEMDDWNDEFLAAVSEYI